MAECPSCGTRLAHGDAICGTCGASTGDATASFAPVSAEDRPAPPAPTAADDPCLVVRKGAQSGERFFLDRPRLCVGRDPQSDIFLNDMTVSRTHAVLTIDGGVVTVTDSGSLNGTYVNGTLVDSARLNSGDVVQIGTFQMAFYEGQGSRSMSSRDYLTIGEVVQRLQPAYPDLSISKVRFLEEEGLITPERTAGGYRKFAASDVTRIEMILRLQRDHFFPLAVIREKLADVDRGRIPAELQRGPMAVAEPLPIATTEDGQLRVDEAPHALGIPVSFVRELAEFGIVKILDGESGEEIDRADVAAVHAAWDLRRFGVEPRHLRMYETFAEREATLFTQILMPAFKHRTPESKQKLGETLTELGSLTDELKGRLLRRALAKAFEDLA